MNTTLHFNGDYFKETDNHDFISPSRHEVFWEVVNFLTIVQCMCMFRWIILNVMCCLSFDVFFIFVKQISDWWQQFVYLRSRESLMINSNYYGVVSICYCHTVGTQLEPWKHYC